MKHRKLLVACPAVVFSIVFGVIVFQNSACEIAPNELNKTQSDQPDLQFVPEIKNEMPPPRITDDVPRQLYSAVHQRRFQKQPRRRKINFPEDCTDEIPAGEKVRYLQMACAEALTAAKPDLQKASAEGGCEYPIDNDKNYPYPVTDDSAILQYTIKKSDKTDIKSVTEKLNTVIETITKNTDLETPIEFKVGQTLNYQKAHYAYDFQPIFHPFSSNKYLVEIRCWTAAYNLSNIYLMYDESAIPAKTKVLEFSWVEPETHIFDDFSDLKPPSDAYIAKYIKIVKEKTVCGFYFNSRTKTLIAYSKGNGMGAFGRYARYSFNRADEPELEEFRAKFYDNVYTYDDIYNHDPPKNIPPNYGYDDMIKRPPKTWKRYYPK